MPTLPDVTVTFNPATKAITCAPNNGDVTVNQAGDSTINIKRPTGQPWKFVGFGIQGEFSGNFNWSIADDQISIIDNDGNQGTTDQCFEYSFIIEYMNEKYTKDPRIINKPGG